MLPTTRATLFLISVLIISDSSLHARDHVPWVHDIATAQQMAATNHLLVLLHFSADDCPPCRQLERKIFNKRIFGHAIGELFVPVNVNVNKHPELKQRFNITAWPTDVVITPDGREVHRMTSPQDMTMYLDTLRKVVWRHKTTAPGAMVANATTPGAPGSAPGEPTAPFASMRPAPQQVAGSSLSGPTANAAGVSSLPPSPMAQTPMTNVHVARPGTQIPGHSVAGNVAGYSMPVGDSAMSAPAVYGGANPAVTSPPMTNPSVYGATAGFTPPPSPTYSAAPASVQNQYVAPPVPTAPRVTHPPVVAESSLYGPPPMASPPTAAAPGTDSAYSAAPAATPQPPAAAARPPATAPPTAHSAVQPATNLAGPGEQEPVVQVSAQTAQQPMMGLEGYCPVTLYENERWAAGDAKWGARHRGRVYLFQTAAAQQRFLAEPDRYSPVLSGFDPVLFLETGQLVEGNRAHGLRVKQSIVLFSSEETLARFAQDPAGVLGQLNQSVATAPNGTAVR